MRISSPKLLLALASSSLLFASCIKDFDASSYAPPLNIGGYTSVREISPANLVGYWSFDADYTDSVSKTAATNTGTTLAPGIKGTAMQGALNAYVVATPTAAITGMTSFTIGYWVNSPLHPAGIAGMVALSNSSKFWGNIEMFLENGGTLEAAKFRGKVITNNATEIGIDKDGIPNFYTKWNHLALSYNQATSTFTFYVNGNVSQTKTQAGLGALNLSNSGKLVFGASPFMVTPTLASHSKEPWASYLTGQLDEVRIYNKALTDAEIGAWVKLEGRGK